jgi:hypothetical protein
MWWHGGEREFVVAIEESPVRELLSSACPRQVEDDGVEHSQGDSEPVTMPSTADTARFAVDQGARLGRERGCRCRDGSGWQRMTWGSWRRQQATEQNAREQCK